MDYKERIEYLRAVPWRKNHCYGCQACEDAADIIETLLAERDAAVEDLSGMCWCCEHGRPWDISGELSRLTTCEYMTGNGVRAYAGRRPCPHWEWRGPQAKRED